MKASKTENGFETHFSTTENQLAKKLVLTFLLNSEAIVSSAYGFLSTVLKAVLSCSELVWILCKSSEEAALQSTFGVIA